MAAKAIATFNRETQLLTFKGGLLEGDTLDADQILAISRLPAREVLYGQLVGVVASPITGLARGLNALLSGVAIALNEVLGKKERGELPAGEAPAASAAPAEDQAAAADVPQAAEDAPPADATEEAPAAEVPAETATEPAASEEPAESGAQDETSTDDTTTDQADASA
jgi:large subunit ribosomal protein L10